MAPTLTTFLFEAANFLILAGVLGWLFFKPIRKILDARRATLTAQAQQAEEKLAEAERLRAEIAHEREALATELEAQRVRARAGAEAEAKAIVAAAQTQALREREAAKQALESLEKAERQRLARAAAAAAKEVMLRLLAQVGDGSLNEALAHAAARELVRLNHGGLTTATIESAQPLDDGERSALATALGSGAAATYRVVPELIGGVRVVTAHAMVDATVAGLTAYAERALADSAGDCENE